MPHITFDRLQEFANSFGLSVVGVADVGALSEDREYLRRWQEAGYAGEMAYMKRDPDLLASPQRVVPQARSVVVVGAFYDRGERAPLPRGHGRVARYAWGRDYHKVIRRRLELLCHRVERDLARSIEHRVFSDSVPLLERALARRSGLGFVGKNSMVIMPRAGSFMFLGEVLWDVEVTDLPNVSGARSQSSEVQPLAIPHCGSCSRCLDQCPTSALVEDRVLDARRCISYLTIEKRGSLSEQERRWLGEWVFGCDVCQDVCPFNVISIRRRAAADCEEFAPRHGAGQSLDLVELLSLRSDDLFARRFAGTPLMRAKREGLVRNAAVVAANTEYEEGLPALAAAIREDPSPVVRAHALWSFAAVGGKMGTKVAGELQSLVALCSRDNDRDLRAEAERIARELA